MFDESIWNQPFPFDSGPVNVKVQPGHDEFLDLLDDTFLDDGGSNLQAKSSHCYNITFYCSLFL